jgi:GTPase SAR1 family protein
MVKYVENKFDEDYIQTLGVNFMEKTITLRSTGILKCHTNSWNISFVTVILS